MGSTNRLFYTVEYRILCGFVERKGMLHVLLFPQFKATEVLVTTAT